MNPTSTLARTLAAEGPVAGRLHDDLLSRGKNGGDIVRSLLTIREARPFAPDLAAQLDTYFGAQATQREVVSAGLLPTLDTRPGGSGVSIWRGDITHLAIDGIVNACNADLLGCFRPFHACIDNAIHSAAGPRLREDCAAQMQGSREPNGRAKITSAHHLPSRCVLHTVGPIVTGPLTSIARSELSSCYRSCLELAADNGLRSLAFCCISTGVFGFPREPAADIALETVHSWLTAHPGILDHIVFNVFSAADEAVYVDALARRGWS